MQKSVPKKSYNLGRPGIGRPACCWIGALGLIGPLANPGQDCWIDGIGLAGDRREVGREVGRGVAAVVGIGLGGIEFL